MIKLLLILSFLATPVFSLAQEDSEDDFDGSTCSEIKNSINTKTLAILSLGLDIEEKECQETVKTIKNVLSADAKTAKKTLGILYESIDQPQNKDKVTSNELNEFIKTAGPEILKASTKLCNVITYSIEKPMKDLFKSLDKNNDLSRADLMPVFKFSLENLDQFKKETKPDVTKAFNEHRNKALYSTVARAIDVSVQSLIEQLAKQGLVFREMQLKLKECNDLPEGHREI